MRAADESEVANWDKLILANPDRGNVLQCRAFAETKAVFGWKPKYLCQASGITYRALTVLILTRHIVGLGEIWYVPKGPGVSNLQELKEFISNIKEQASKAFAIKLEPELMRDDVSDKEMLKLSLVKARDLQFNVNTVVVNLKPSEDDILASFRQKTRYNVRLAQKHGVVAEPAECSQESIDLMYGLMEATRDRAGFYLRSKEYFATFWSEHAKRGNGQFFFAKYNGQVLGGVFATYLGVKALYKDGGSIREHSNLQAPYLLQWEVMRWLKAKGVTEYDMHGTPPTDQLENEQHPFYSLGRFKTGFNAEVTEYVGTWDLVLDRGKYELWQKFGERVAQTYEHRVKGQLFY